MVTMLVAITCCIDRGRKFRAGYDYVYLNRAYARAVAAAGLTPVLVNADAPADELAQACAGLVLSGGDDLPRSFGASDGEGALGAGGVANGELTNGESTLGDAEDAERVAWERATLDAFGARRKPVLGICYGMQLINLHFGGTLYRDLRSEHDGAGDHGGSGRVAHHQTIKTGSSVLLEGLTDQFETNSSHGQAVESVAPGFRLTARATDGIIEAIENQGAHGGAGVFGIEWHPESDATGARVYGNFAKLLRR